MENLEEYIKLLLEQKKNPAQSMEITEKERGLFKLWKYWKKIDAAAEAEKTLKTLKSFSEQKYFSETILEEIKTLPKEDILDIGLEIKKVVPDTRKSFYANSLSGAFHSVSLIIPLAFLIYLFLSFSSFGSNKYLLLFFLTGILMCYVLPSFRLGRFIVLVFALLFILGLLGEAFYIFIFNVILKRGW